MEGKQKPIQVNFVDKLKPIVGSEVYSNYLNSIWRSFIDAISFQVWVEN